MAGVLNMLAYSMFLTSNPEAYVDYSGNLRRVPGEVQPSRMSTQVDGYNGVFWLAVRELELSFHHVETTIFLTYPYSSFPNP